MMAEQKQIRPLATWMWWGFFILATWVMSLWFDASRAFFAEPGWERALEWAAVMGLLFMVMLVLMYDSYVKEKTRGKVHRPVRLFEWIYERQYGDRSGGSTR